MLWVLVFTQFIVLIFHLFGRKIYYDVFNNDYGVQHFIRCHTYMGCVTLLKRLAGVMVKALAPRVGCPLQPWFDPWLGFLFGCQTHLETNVEKKSYARVMHSFICLCITLPARLKTIFLMLYHVDGKYF